MPLTCELGRRDEQLLAVLALVHDLVRPVRQVLDPSVFALVEEWRVLVHGDLVCVIEPLLLLGGENLHLPAATDSEGFLGALGGLLIGGGGGGGLDAAVLVGDDDLRDDVVGVRRIEGKVVWELDHDLLFVSGEREKWRRRP